MPFAHCSFSVMSAASRAAIAALAFGLVGFSGQAFAAPAGGNTYQQERAACMDGRSQQDRTTCLREAGAARGEAKRGHLTDSTSYEENATARCNVLPPSDRQDCVKRIHGQGTTSGSVEGGGIYRETTTTVVGTPPPPPSSVTPPSPAPTSAPAPQQSYPPIAPRY
ncbi:hypothetical protein [Oxalicibacterium solurbis]|uniref:Uncharacterized protein n=1 Tax=Oxalicibacterium solurbis TaxID=69280 RepID=A0A8J3B2N9_9BURK|nr:hypothetical protein [Oxalicibacterium solurbis]GGI53790.1 hypothetical protein GCM10011430_09640 [Oxalicibacterium solurbis]